MVRKADTRRSLEPESTSGDSGSGSDAKESAKSKASHRRAQIRRAQIQHRQRKVNYTKELEMDVTRLRDMIEQAEWEGHALRAESNLLRQKLTLQALAAGVTNLTLPPPVITTFIRLEETIPQPTQPTSAPQLPVVRKAQANFAEWASASIPAYTVRMDTSDVTQPPAYQVSRRGSGVSSSTIDLGTEVVSGGSLTRLDSAGLTPAQTDMAINFILALERICWDHFYPPYFSHEDYDPLGMEHGHAMMASHIVLQQASPEVFRHMDIVRKQIEVQGTHSFHSTPHCSLQCTEPPKGIEWRSTGLDLEALYGMATTLNPPDRELAPVQAWFEVVKAYGPEIGLDTLVLESLKREFAGVVKCIHFGAVIERDAFDSIVGRVVAARLEAMGVDMGMNLGIEDVDPMQITEPTQAV